MPGFFEAMSRMIQGKPVFTPTDQQGGDPLNQPPREQEKTPPQVWIERFECHPSGDRVECYAALKNHSQVNVELDKIHILGSMRELDNFLRPGEEREFLVYSGSVPTTNAYHDADIQYKDPDGKYWVSRIYVDFEQEDDGKWLPNDARFVPPVRDIV
jgi:hypothetical protein